MAAYSAVQLVPIAVLEPIEPPTEVDTVIDTSTEADGGKQEMLWQLVQDCGAEISAGERDIFYSTPRI